MIVTTHKENPVKKHTRSPFGTFLLALIADPTGVVQNALARVVKRTALARQRMKAAPQGGFTTLEAIIWIGGIAVIAIAIIALLQPIIEGWINKIPK
uniref:Uncharacterized protein n=1 Tax=Brevibacterium sp. Ap13 TaxID=1406197 RepID=U5NZM4_9MICO|nr:hypothetical protein [Brevibacterium sp. Ap13]AGY35370.1 hypothetical protein AP13_p00610 [Brevibacterium sp. Ap13]